MIPLKEKSTNDHYENPLTCVCVPCSSPLPIDEIKIEKETEYEYASLKKTSKQENKDEYTSSKQNYNEETIDKCTRPITMPSEKSLLKITHFQPNRNLSFNRSIMDIRAEKQPLHSASSSHWFQYELTSQIPTTFQPNSINDERHEHETISTKENFYTSDINAYLPSSATDRNEDDDLQMHLINQTILPDDFYFEYRTQQTSNFSSMLNGLSYLFTSKHKSQSRFNKKSTRCSIM